MVSLPKTRSLGRSMYAAGICRAKSLVSRSEMMRRETISAPEKRTLATCGEPPEEDVYMQQCLQLLGVKQTDHFDLLAEEHCASTDWKTCQSRHVSFHPFKTVSAFKHCLGAAERLHFV